MTYEREQAEDLLTFNMQNQSTYIDTNREREREQCKQRVATIRVTFALQGRFHVDYCEIIPLLSARHFFSFCIKDNMN